MNIIPLCNEDNPLGDNSILNLFAKTSNTNTIDSFIISFYYEDKIYLTYLSDITEVALSLLTEKNNFLFNVKILCDDGDTSKLCIVSANIDQEMFIKEYVKLMEKSINYS